MSVEGEQKFKRSRSISPVRILKRKSKGHHHSHDKDKDKDRGRAKESSKSKLERHAGTRDARSSSPPKVPRAKSKLFSQFKVRSKSPPSLALAAGASSSSAIDSALHSERAAVLALTSRLLKKLQGIDWARVSAYLCELLMSAGRLRAKKSGKALACDCVSVLVADLLVSRLEATALMCVILRRSNAIHCDVPFADIDFDVRFDAAAVELAAANGKLGDGSGSARGYLRGSSGDDARADMESSADGALSDGADGNDSDGSHDSDDENCGNGAAVKVSLRSRLATAIAGSRSSLEKHPSMASSSTAMRPASWRRDETVRSGGDVDDDGDDAEYLDAGNDRDDDDDDDDGGGGGLGLRCSVSSMAVMEEACAVPSDLNLTSPDFAVAVHEDVVIFLHERVDIRDRRSKSSKKTIEQSFVAVDAIATLEHEFLAHRDAIVQLLDEVVDAGYIVYTGASSAEMTTLHHTDDGADDSSSPRAGGSGGGSASSHDASLSRERSSSSRRARTSSSSATPISALVGGTACLAPSQSISSESPSLPAKTAPAATLRSLASSASGADVGMFGQNLTALYRLDERAMKAVNAARRSRTSSQRQRSLMKRRIAEYLSMLAWQSMRRRRSVLTFADYEPTLRPVSELTSMLRTLVEATSHRDRHNRRNALANFVRVDEIVADCQLFVRALKQKVPKLDKIINEIVDTYNPKRTSSSAHTYAAVVPPNVADFGAAFRRRASRGSLNSMSSLDGTSLLADSTGSCGDDDDTVSDDSGSRSVVLGKPTPQIPRELLRELLDELEQLEMEQAQASSAAATQKRVAVAAAKRSPASVSLKTIGGNVELSARFKSFLSKSHSIELWLYWEAIDRFDALFASIGNASLCSDAATSIFVRFIAPDAPMQLNCVDSCTFEQLKSAIETPNADIFQGVTEQVHSMLLYEVARFKQSKTFKQWWETFELDASLPAPDRVRRAVDQWIS
jgi:Regulator of G protein signaling domain